MGRMKGLGFTTGTVPSVLTRTFWIFLFLGEMQPLCQIGIRTLQCMNLKFKKTLKKNPMASGAECIQQVQSLLPGTLENRETEVDVVLRSLLMRLLHIDAFVRPFRLSVSFIVVPSLSGR